jgi:hypothetical protein
MKFIKNKSAFKRIVFEPEVVFLQIRSELAPLEIAEDQTPFTSA